MLSNHAENIMDGVGNLAVSNLRQDNEKSYYMLVGAVYELVIVKYVSFYDEFMKHSDLIPDKELQMSLRAKLNVNRKLWPDLKNYRNQIVAHNYRKGLDSIFLFANGVTYIIPRTDEEFLELAVTMKEINLLLKYKYPKEFDEFEKDRVGFVKRFVE